MYVNMNIYTRNWKKIKHVNNLKETTLALHKSKNSKVLWSLEISLYK